MKTTLSTNASATEPETRAAVDAAGGSAKIEERPYEVKLLFDRERPEVREVRSDPPLYQM